jgi:hypothetical protein
MGRSPERRLETPRPARLTLQNAAVDGGTTVDSRRRVHFQPGNFHRREKQPTIAPWHADCGAGGSSPDEPPVEKPADIPEHRS